MITHPLEAAKRLRERWDAGEPTYGGWLHTRDSLATEIVARAGFDWICLDTQHGMARAGDVLPLLQAGGVTETPVVVRVPWNDPGVIMNALDAGASGVIIPMINSALEAEEAVAACRYPPSGTRSWGPTRSSLGMTGYSATWANDRVLCIVMIETQTAADRVAEIVAVPGIDAVFIGPADLALSLGTERAAAVNATAIAEIKLHCDAAGVPAGIATTSAEEGTRATVEGFALIALPSDAVLLSQGCATVLGRVRDS